MDAIIEEEIVRDGESESAFRLDPCLPFWQLTCRLETLLTMRCGAADIQSIDIVSFNKL